MLSISVCRSYGSSAVNEDVAGHCGNAAWVIDGATGLGAHLMDGPSDAAWLATRADRELRAAFARDADRSTADILRAVIAACRGAFVAGRRRPSGAAFELPSAAIAIVRQVGDTVELATLGDCRIADRDRGGVARLFGTTALDAFEGRMLAFSQRVLTQLPTFDPPTCARCCCRSCARIAR